MPFLTVKYTILSHLRLFLLLVNYAMMDITCRTILVVDWEKFLIVKFSEMIPNDVLNAIINSIWIIMSANNTLTLLIVINILLILKIRVFHVKIIFTISE